MPKSYTKLYKVQSIAWHSGKFHSSKNLVIRLEKPYFVDFIYTVHDDIIWVYFPVNFTHSNTLKFITFWKLTGLLEVTENWRWKPRHSRGLCQRQEQHDHEESWGINSGTWIPIVLSNTGGIWHGKGFHYFTQIFIYPHVHHSGVSCPHFRT